LYTLVRNEWITVYAYAFSGVLELPSTGKLPRFLGTRRKELGLGAVLVRRALVLLVAAIMASMMSMGPAMASYGTYGTYGGGQGGGPNGGDGGGQVVKHNFKKHHKYCWKYNKYTGKYRYVPCKHYYYW